MLAPRLRATLMPYTTLFRSLREGMDVQMLELPEGEDPDSFVRQFGKDSFLEMHGEESEDFLTYLIHKAKEEGRWENPAQKTKVRSEEHTSELQSRFDLVCRL